MSQRKATHEEKQREVIDLIEKELSEKSISFSTVTPVKDFENDNRLCLTSVHFPHSNLIEKIQNDIIKPLRRILPDAYWYSNDSLHMTIKNIRVIHDPPHFSSNDITNAERVFCSTVPTHRQFKVFFYRLLLFPNNLALIGTTESELDRIILDLDKQLSKFGIADDKIYINKRYFFSNITLARFSKPLSRETVEQIDSFSTSFAFAPYIVDSVTLLTCNAAMKRRKIIQTFSLSDDSASLC